MRILLNDISTWPCPTPYLPAVRGCTDSRALVKSAIFFEAPPCFTCCRWYFLSSESGIKRFIILWYWTSTWRRAKAKKIRSCTCCASAAHQLLRCWCLTCRFTMLHLGLSGLLEASKWTSFLSNWVWSTYASFTIWRSKCGRWGRHWVRHSIRTFFCRFRKAEW